MTATSTKPLKVLVAEDNEVNQLLLKTLLEEGGWQTTIVTNGQECVEALRKESFSLILMDIQMPVMDGFEATRIIRNELQSSILIIGISANADEADIQKSLNAGMNGHMSKFFNLSQLQELMGIG